jgi:hypothetical protein
MIRPRLSTILLFNTGVALAAVACGQGKPDTLGTGGGAAVGSGASGGATSGSAGKGGSGATGGSTGGTGGSTGGTGGSTGGTGGSFGGRANVTGGSAGVGAGGKAVGGSGGIGAGGNPVGGSAGMGTGATGSGNCTITSMATQSAAISTVFNVAFTTDLPGVDSAHIDFGIDTTYGLTAPVDLKDATTPLLGMKPMKTYHYRVVVGAGATTCSGADQTVTTGPLANGMPKPMITTNNAMTLTGGFLLSEWYAGQQMVFILDKDNDFVWWFDPKTVNMQFGDLTRARMSTDGKSMWIGHGNVPNMTGRMLKVAMDGSNPQDLSSSFTNMNHDFTIVNDAMGDWIYFIAYGASGAACDDIREYSPTGMVRTVMNIGAAFTSGMCHANAIEYSKEDDTLVISELDHDAYVKIKRTTGEKVWVLGGGTNNNFTGDAATWDNEHNCEVLGANHLLMFNNGSGTAGSNAIEIMLDPNAMTATKMWEYTASPVINNVIMGDVQRLPNGNTLITYSTQGIIHEVDANKNLLQSLSWGTGGALGYAIKRPTLYGPSPK